MIEKLIEDGYVQKADTMEELAEKLNLPVETTVASWKHYNEMAAAGEDTDYYKEKHRLMAIDTPPFYGVRLWPKVHHCMGGVKTDLDCRVLDMELAPIPGLFAAGEAAGGVHGACRLGSCATTDCLVNGRIAGQKAAAEATA